MTGLRRPYAQLYWKKKNGFSACISFHSLINAKEDEDEGDEDEVDEYLQTKKYLQTILDS